MKSLAKICLILVSALTLATYTAQAQADSTATTNKPAAAPKPRAKPINGTIASVDSSAKTITITLTSGDSQTIHIGSKTRITKDGEPATLADAAAGQKVRAYAKKDDAGDLMATSVRIGEAKPKAAATPPAAKQ